MLNKAQQETPLNDEVNDYLSKQGIQWKLIVELAPWIGEFYERLVGLTKELLRKNSERNVFLKCISLLFLLKWKLW